MLRKTQHTRFEDKILRKLANEDKPQVVTACVYVHCICMVGLETNSLLRLRFAMFCWKVGVPANENLFVSFAGVR